MLKGFQKSISLKQIFPNFSSTVEIIGCCAYDSPEGGANCSQYVLM